MDTHRVILHLTLIDGIGPLTIHTIIKNKLAQDSWADLYRFKVDDFVQLGVSDTNAQKLVVGLQSQILLEREVRLIEKHRINYCTILDDTYPELLAQIHLPPAVLYWQGAPLNAPQKKIAIVGSRKANEYGAQIVRSIVPQLVHHDVTIVSGGAFGVDCMAHQATVDAGGSTIVVLGSGLLNPSPRSNIQLFNRIVAAGGSIVSAFPLNEEPYPSNFPARNRIISGLSNGTVVVQAAKKSGARITAQYALDQGRDVFAIPGPIDDPLSVGCHRLIQEGAKLIVDANDVLVEYGFEAPEQMTVFDQKKEGKKNKYETGSIEDIIVQACTKPQSVDELAVQVGLDLAGTQEKLFNLQLAGDVHQDFTGMWKRV